MTRINFDAYYTPEVEFYVKTLVDKVNIKKDSNILEPCNGKGNISHFLEELDYENLYTNDIDNKYYSDFNFDASKSIFWDILNDEIISIDWVVTNPPFNKASEIIKNAWQYSNVGIAFLLRLSFLEPCKNRYKFLEEYSDNMTHLITFNPRPRFIEGTDQTDSVTVAWLVYQKNFSWQRLGLDCPFVFAHKIRVSK